MRNESHPDTEPASALISNSQPPDYEQSIFIVYKLRGLIYFVGNPEQTHRKDN